MSQPGPSHPQARATRAMALAVAGLAAALAGWLAATAGMLWATLADAERGSALALLAPRAALLVLAALLLLAALAWAVPRAYRRWLLAPARLLDQARVLLGSDSAPAIAPPAGADLQGLAQVINQLVAQRRQLRQDVAQQVREASREIEQERNRLAALMSELSQAVVVCNLDGRVLLYNDSARAEFRTLSLTPTLANGGELIGLGRSIYAVFDRRLLDHSLEKIDRELQQGQASPSAQFLTSTASGQLLRVQMAPVRAVQAADAPAAPGAPGAPPALNGFVLMLANITREFELAAERDQLLLGLTEGGRASLGNLSAAVEMLEYPDLDEAQRQRFQAVVHDELATMRCRIHDLAQRNIQGLATRWPLEDILGADLVAAAVRRISAAPDQRAAAAECDPALWLKVDSFSLLQALAYLAGRLADEYAIGLVQLRLMPAPAAAGGPASHAHLDLVWTGQAMSTETVMSWEADAMHSAGQASPLTVREVVQRHGGEFWFERERVRHQAFFRFLLPLAHSQAQTQTGPGTAETPAAQATLSPQDSRPAYYDFDLFKATDAARALVIALASKPASADALKATALQALTTNLKPNVKPAPDAALGNALKQLLASDQTAGAVLPLIGRWNFADQVGDAAKSAVIKAEAAEWWNQFWRP